MIKHLALISEPNGTIPLLGDSDGGQLLCLSQNKNNIKGACCTAAILLRDGELKQICGAEFQEETLWLLGSSGLERFYKLKEAPLKYFHSINHETGLYCFRSGLNEKDSSIIIDCGSHGWKKCGHSHADLLSYEWYCNGSRILVDPGTYTYSRSEYIRNENRSSQNHNTVTINGLSQSIPVDTFRWKKIAHPKNVFSKFSEDLGYFEGEHDAYERFGCKHKRILMFFGKELSLVLDLINVSETISSLLYNLQFNEGKLVHLKDNIYQFREKNNGCNHYIRFFGTENFSVDIGEGAIFPDYNKAVKAPKLEFKENDSACDQKIITILCDDRKLIESFTFDGMTWISGSIPTSRYSIYVGESETSFKKGDTNSIETAAFVQKQDETFVLLRNSKIARSISDDIRFESDRRHDYALAVIRDRVLYLQVDKIPAFFLSPNGILELYINGSNVPFQKDERSNKIRIKQGPYEASR